ncbi:hypothetical protein K501DRAFT_269706 [Backusella circina FSU 941]|nr:hypothetical protein K501DRAFT_269706 [Backusella circina FSU 941]
MKLATLFLGSSFLMFGALSAPLEKRGWGDHLQVNFFWDGGCSDFAYQYDFTSQTGTSWVTYEECKAFDGSNIWSAGIAVTEVATTTCVLYTDSNCKNYMTIVNKKGYTDLAELGVNNKNGNGICINDNGQHIAAIKCIIRFILNELATKKYT